MGFDPVQIVAEWLRNLLLGWGASDLLTEVILKFIGAFLVAAVIMLVFILLTWVERKGAARFQDRIGPNRVGPFGLIQPIADALKMLTKEDTRPEGADAVSYELAPILAVFSVLMAWAVIPFTETWIGADLSVGVMYIAAVGSFGVISVMMAGWSSNNKYSLIGAFRGVAQLISYEVPLFLSLLVPVFLARSMGVNSIVEAQGQGGVWFIVMAPLAAIIYFVSALAEVGRAPFDLLEAESEIVAGYHVEYSGIKFGLFQAAEFLHSFTFAALMSILFFGGWHGPWADQYMLLGLV
jgi:NADH-quinone oxidoreductase subunit H